MYTHARPLTGRKMIKILRAAPKNARAHDLLFVNGLCPRELTAENALQIRIYIYMWCRIRLLSPKMYRTTFARYRNV